MGSEILEASLAEGAEPLADTHLRLAGLTQSTSQHLALQSKVIDHLEDKHGLKFIFCEGERPGRQ